MFQDISMSEIIFVRSIPKLQNEEQNQEEASNKQEIQKKKQQIKTAKIKNYKASSLQKKKISFSLKVKVEEKAKVSYKVVSYPKNAKKYISVSSKGLVTLKKGAPKGTYKIKITANETKQYLKTTKTISIKLK